MKTWFLKLFCVTFFVYSAGCTSTEVRIPRQDGTMQPAVFIPSDAKEATPLVVYLHSWTNNYNATIIPDTARLEVIEQCKQRGWSFISPNFRGPNIRPEACASALAKQDVMDAVAYAHNNDFISEVYLLGKSGGGHMALIMAAHAPETWAKVSAWVPVTDLEVWYEQCEEKYRLQLEAICGGPPNESTRPEYRSRSPIHHLDNAAGLPITIYVGVHDTVIPPSHGIKAFNVLADANMMPQQKIDPKTLQMLETDAGSAKLILFDGGHEMLPTTAISHLAKED